MPTKIQSISNVLDTVGWAYEDMKWLTATEAANEKRRRKQQLKALGDKASYSFGKSKLHIGRLSRGCISCGSGKWACIYLTNKCPARCFFCSQNRNARALPPLFQGMSFSRPNDLVSFLKYFKFSGVAFTGGDPIADFRKLTRFIKSVRNSFDKDIYIWAYTSGILVDKDKLRELARVGLDEIRFNIASHNYNVRSVSLARSFIKNVTVEIPAIPEDYGRLTKAIIKLERIGIDHLNLHELRSTRLNYREFVKRDYTFLHRECCPILESEITALKIMEFVIRNDIKIPVNYCTISYKDRYQLSGYRKMAASVITKENEQITESGYIRTIYFNDSRKSISSIIKALKKHRVDKKMWEFNMEKNCMTIHPSLIDKIQNIVCKRRIFSILYSKAFMSDYRIDEVEDYVRVKLNKQKTIYVSRIPVHEETEMNLEEVKCLVLNSYNKDNNVLVDVSEEYERIASGFEEIY